MLAVTSLVTLALKNWKLAAAGIGLAGFALVFALFVHFRNADRTLTKQLAAATAQAATYAADAQRNETALEADAQALEARTVANTALKEKIDEAQDTSVCADSPALAALFDGLRSDGDAGPPQRARTASHVRR